MSEQSAIAIDLGGTKCAGAIITEKGEIIHRDTRKVTGLSGDSVAVLITNLVGNLIEKSKIDGLKINGIGVSVPGISYKSSGTVWAPNIPGWVTYPLKTKLLNVVPQEYTIEIDSDRACSILGEVWLGAAVGIKDAIFLAVGTGIGAGILTNGTILRGAQDIAGSVGWLALDSVFKDDYERFGCFEYHASGDGLSRVAAELLKEGNYKKSSLGNGQLNAANIFEACKQNDPLAKEVINRAIQFWGMATANLISIFNPEMIIFGGGVFGPALAFMNDIRNESLKWGQPIATKQVKLVGSKLGKNAALFGAANLILS